MKFFIDTADISQIQKAIDRGWIDGVTTNPSLVAKSGRNFRELIKEICSIVDGPVSAEVIALESGAIYKEGLELAKLADNVVVKVPATEEGLIAVKKFTADGIKTNVTLVFSALQAILVAKAGATMISPFVGRLDDIGQDGMSLIQDILDIYQNYQFETEVLVASVRSTAHILSASLLGADICTVPYGVLAQMMNHPLTTKGLEIFMSDWEKAKA